MDSTLWYLLAFCGIFALSFCLWALKFLFPRFRNQFIHSIKYPIILSRGRYWDSVTRLQGCFLLLFILLNLSIIFSPFTPLDWGQVERRAAFASGVNMIPVCLGGRIGPVSKVFNIHRTTYRLLHRWIGRIAIIDGLIHATIVLSLRPRAGSLVTSGWVTFGAMLASMVFSLCIVRFILGRWFLLSHRLFTLSSLAALFWHVLQQSNLSTQVVIGISIGIWATFTIYRLYTLLGRRLTAEILEISGDSRILKVELLLRKPTKILPGEYFHIFFPGTVAPYTLLNGYPAVVAWHLPEEVNPSLKISNVTFLLSRGGRYAHDIAKLARGQRLLLEGPFGKNYKLRTFENIILPAKGLGIAGVLPLALELAERRRHDDVIRMDIQSLSKQLESETLNREERLDLQTRRSALLRRPLFRDATKKIDIFWSLESNTQMTVVESQFRSLQNLDPHNKFLVVWCGFPAQRVGPEPFVLSPYWMCLDPSRSRQPFDSLIVSKIHEERRKSHGNMIVIACGSQEFSDTMRQTVIGSGDGMSIEFMEAEFRP